MSFSELLFTFQPFSSQPSIYLPLQSFRLLSRTPHTRPICCPYIRPICCPHARHSRFPLFSFFRFSRFRLLNKYARPRTARTHIRPHTYPARALARGTHVYSNVSARPLKTTRAFCRSIIKKPRNVVGVFVILISCGQTRQKPSGVTIISPVWTAAVREASTHSTADFVRFATLNSLKTSLLRSSFSI